MKKGGEGEKKGKGREGKGRVYVGGEENVHTVEPLNATTTTTTPTESDLEVPERELKGEVIYPLNASNKICINTNGAHICSHPVQR